MLIRHAKDANGRICDFLLQDGKIAAIGINLPAAEGEEVVDAAGLTILPAFIDTHCHWREPGFEYKEDVATGSAAAAAGGYTFVNLMPNTKPVCSDAETAHAVMARAAEVGLCDANQTVSITRNFDGHTLDHLLTLPDDLRYITEDGNGVLDNAVMARAFAIATDRDLTIMSHAEDREISPWDYRLAENIETLRNCHLAEYYGTKLHMCHVSTKEAVDMVRQSRRRGARVSCEVTPHHLWFDDKRLRYKVNPPIREAADVQALVRAIQDGTVSCIGTDHAPHTVEDKAGGAAGMVGLETAFGVCYTKLCRLEGLPLEHLSFLMSAGPAELLGLGDRKGQLAPGYDADIVLVAFGATSRICRSAVRAARDEGIKAGLIRPITLWPFPEEAIRATLPTAKAYLTVEMNMGQMVDDVRLVVNGAHPVDFYGRTGGVIPTPDEVLGKIREIAADLDSAKGGE